MKNSNFFYSYRPSIYHSENISIFTFFFLSPVSSYFRFCYLNSIEIIRIFVVIILIINFTIFFFELFSLHIWTRVLFIYIYISFRLFSKDKLFRWNQFFVDIVNVMGKRNERQINIFIYVFTCVFSYWNQFESKNIQTGFQR